MKADRIDVGSIRVEPEHFSSTGPGNVRIGTAHASGLVRNGTVVVEGADVHDLLTALTTAIRVGWVKGPHVTLIDETTYDLCARAFGVSRDDAKNRILGAIYGKKGAEVLANGGPALRRLCQESGPSATSAVKETAVGVGWDPYGDEA